MIAQSHKTRCFKSLARYLEHPKPDRSHLRRVEWTEQRNIAYADGLQDVAWEMTIVARGSERVQKPVFHVSVSWAPEDEPTRRQMTTVADELVGTVSLSDHQAVYVSHADESYKHLHIMANLVHPVRRKVQNPGKYYGRFQAVLRHAERRYGFREVPGHYYQLPGQQAPDRSMSLSKGAHKALSRDHTLPFQLVVKRVAERDFREASSWQDLNQRLDRHGLRLLPRRSGLVVTDGHEFAKSSSIAACTSRRLLEERFGTAFTPCIQLSRNLQKDPPGLEAHGYQWDTPGSDELGL